MTDKRKDDEQAHSQYRPDRLFKDGGKWYFQTREGTMEGPFEERHAAEAKLDQYKGIMTSGWISSESELSLEPLDPPKP
jgi:hypothetical protein